MAVKVVLISGCSSGLGYQLSIQLARSNKYLVYAGVRKEADFDRLSGIPNLFPVYLDVTLDASVEAAVEKIRIEHGGINVLVNNAAYSVFGGVESIPLSDCQAQFDTNFFGCVRLIQRVLPFMREQGSGLILNIGSIGGIWGQPLSDLYCASKFALEGLTESMASYYRNFGVRVAILEPGAIATEILLKANMSNVKNTPDALKPVYDAVQAFYDARVNHGQSGAQTPDEVAEFCIKEIIEFNGKDDEFPLRFQCNPHVQPIFDMKLHDLDGLKLLKFTQSRILKSLQE